MNKEALSGYAPQARRDFIRAVTDRAAHFGLTATKVEPITEKGDMVIASRAHCRNIQKEQDKPRRQQAELFAFDEKLKHYADQRITLNHDDGVKVNDGKFGDLLAEVKAVCGRKEEDGTDAGGTVSGLSKGGLAMSATISVEEAQEKLKELILLGPHGCGV